MQIVRVNHIQILQKISSQGFTVVKETTGEVYFKAATDGLTIYFPLDEENMTAAWAYYLPTELEKFLGISNSKAKLIISSILQLSGAPLQKILDSEEIGGIEPVDPYSSLTETSVSAKARGGLFGTSNNILPKTRFGGSGVGGFSQSPTTSKSQGFNSGLETSALAKM